MGEPKRVIVCGSRGWQDREAIARTMHDLVLLYGETTVIVHGGALGADRIAEEEAHKVGLRTEVYLPRYDLYGRSAPLKRNEKMAALGADLCIAFWDGSSTGTKDMMERAGAHGIQVHQRG